MIKFQQVTEEDKEKYQAGIDSYKFICWLNGVVPSARVIRDLLRKKRGYIEEELSNAK